MFSEGDTVTFTREGWVGTIVKVNVKNYADKNLCIEVDFPTCGLRTTIWCVRPCELEMSDE